jgi:3(or 17)beta-hydroxysteroid dehydrogenase
MGKRLQEKTALITGGGSGIGAACAKRFAEESATVIVADIDLAAASAIADEITSVGGNARAVQLDVCQPEAWVALFDQFRASQTQLDILINNAGIALPGTTEECRFEDWQATQRVNLDGVFLGTQAAIHAMKLCGGSIINISSIEGIVGNPGLAAYNASKGGVRIFSKAAALECCQKGYAIRINSVHPGLVRTAIIDKALAQVSEEEGRALLASLTDKTPMGRIGEPREIANACLFLASDESSYMTGSELVIDGGYTAQ